MLPPLSNVLPGSDIARSAMETERQKLIVRTAFLTFSHIAANHR
ncbi:hypothetical protein CIT292_10441 [Citrobacter youngae ATCC 29220]|uniref:Uncharacterized protein n=1 Tax=Citrobacter youngae ATCC 29220 TaxID=500640 RepID=D4BIS4_9ENTR|nr:hypothetical protein CIT292_10441 [Citrobacter youngae ATCC 29220]